MAPSNHPLISSLFFIWLASTNIQAAVPSSTKLDSYNLTFPQHSHFLHRVEHASDEVFGDKYYAYAYCGRIGYGTNSKNCDVVLAQFDNERLLSNKTCNVNFTSSAGGPGLSLLRIHSAHNDRVVFYVPNPVNVSVEELENPIKIDVELEVVHMDSCQLYKNKVSVVKPLKAVSGYGKIDIFHHEDNTFDVLLPHAPCDGAVCKYTFDDKVQQLSGPVPLLPAQYKDNIVRVYPLKSPNAYFAFVVDVPLSKKDEDTYETVVALQKLLYVKDDVVTQVTNFSIEVSTMSLGGDKLYVKHSGDLFGFCRQYTAADGVKRVNCMQFDENNNKRIDVTVDLEKSSKLLGLYNAPKGLLVIEASCDQDFLCSGFGIRKVDLQNHVRVAYLETVDIPTIFTTAQSDDDGFFITTYGITRRADKAGTVDTLMTKIGLPNSVTYFK